MSGFVTRIKGGELNARTYKVAHEQCEDWFYISTLNSTSVVDHIKQQQDNVDSMIRHQETFPSLRIDWQCMFLAVSALGSSKQCVFCLLCVCVFFCVVCFLLLETPLFQLSTLICRKCPEYRRATFCGKSKYLLKNCHFYLFDGGSV